MTTAGSPRLDTRPDTSNERIADALIRHQIFLLRYARQLAGRAAEILNEDDELIAAAILAGYSQTNRARIARLAARIGRIRRGAWLRVGELFRPELASLSAQEAEFVEGATVNAVPFELAIASGGSVAVAQIVAGAKTLSQYLREARASDLSAIEGALFLSQNRALSAPEASRAVVGRARARGRDGVLQQARNNIATVARTMVTAVTDETRSAFYRANPRLISREIFVAVLDGRTTPICRATDGSIHDVGEGPHPPLHRNCRSLRAPLIDGEVVGRRNATPIFYRRLLREYAQRNGIRPIPTTRDALPRGHKGSFDLYRRARAFEVVGTEPLRGVNWERWLRSQARTFQDDVLGPTRARLWRRGGFTLQRFVDDSGRQYTLPELARRDAQAFRDAGLDPSGFG